MSITRKIENTWGAISPVAKAAFFGALIIGFITHATGITNLFVNHDFINGLFPSAGPSITHGRWLAGITVGLGGSVSYPGTNIVLGILCLAASTGIIVSLLQMKSRVFACLSGILMVTFPSVVSVHSYNSSFPSFLGILLAVLSVYFADRKKAGVILSVVPLALSLAIYQTYIGFAAGLFVLKMILDCFRGIDDTRKFVLRGMRYVLILIISIICYYVTLQIQTRVLGMPLSPYRGVSEMGNIRFRELPNLIFLTYKKVIDFFVFDLYGEHTSFSAWLYRFLLLCGGFSYLFLAVKTKLYKNKLHLFFSAVLMVLFPLAIHSVAVLGQNANTHWNMIHPFILLPVMVMTFADLAEQYVIRESGEGQAGAWRRALLKGMWLNAGLSLLAALTVVIGAAQSYEWFVVTGECYTALRLGNSAAYAASVQLCADLNDEGYQEFIPLALVGDYRYSVFATRVNDYVKSQYTGVTGSYFAATGGRLYNYLARIVGFDFTQASDQEIELVSGKAEVLLKMPVYPAEGSIRLVDGIMVVKMSDFQSSRTEALKGSDIEGNRVVEYSAQDEPLEIIAGEEEPYKYQRIFTFTRPNEIFILSSDNVECTSGTAETVDIALYQRESKTVILKKSVTVGESFEWIFRTPDSVSYSECELLIYAGERGKTGGNVVACEGILLQRVE